MEADEDLPEPRPRSMSRRRVVVLVITAAAVLTVATVVLLAHHRKPTRQDAAPTRDAATPTTSSSVITTTSVPPPPPRPGCLDVGVGTHTCGITPYLPRSAVAAVQRLLPGAAVTAATTFIGRDGAVYSRQATLRTADGATLHLRIGPRSGQPGSVTVPGPPGATVVQFAVDHGRRYVQMVVRAPAGVSSPDLAHLRTLAADPRLLAVR